MNEQEPKNKIGMKVYYDLQSGNVIVITPESAGIVVETTREQDFKLYKALDDKVPDSVGMIQLEYGAYMLDRAEGGTIARVDLETLEPLFDYQPKPDEEPQPPMISFTFQIAELAAENQRLREENNTNQFALMELHMMLLSLMPNTG
ncbi:hypothetical protein BS614_10180 [Paenibacillus xylanexedens]|uniref:hypothetical protein n=1 Tax=Paenibacillus xylanexedens TaxID=528191 RepID=UPI0009388277|nr:hypothetical protein [Paenibacillus xylanexedens]APO44336.1 hypothetical protein BS614_10180 [Paenibacillus xylanexedens]